MKRKQKYLEVHPEAHAIIEKLGGSNEVAKMLKTSAAAVSYYKRWGIPHLRMIQLQFLRPDLIEVKKD